MNDEIGKSLGLEPLDDVVEGKVVQRTEVPTDDKMNKDYEYARSNFYNVIESGTEALEQMLDVAKASEHPRAYEVVSTIMKTLVDANKDLVAMSTKKVESEEKANSESPNGLTTNNNLFVGSTNELQQLIKDMKNSDG
jgi:flagellar biosynthesis chaperone FliJ|tara:strand:- start:505 stop:918 length:414 start_codon:yes stop_codon:yes gene_type:complete